MDGMYDVVYSKLAKKDSRKLEQAGLKEKVVGLLKIIKNNPFQNPPPYEKMLGFPNKYSRRINKQHRLTYTVEDNEITIIRMWTHYE